MLDDKSTITFYLIETPQPTCIDSASGTDEKCFVPVCIGMDEMSKTEEYSTRFKDQLLPRLN